jgi:hypothetical protein
MDTFFHFYLILGGTDFAVRLCNNFGLQMYEKAAKYKNLVKDYIFIAFGNDNF